MMEVKFNNLKDAFAFYVKVKGILKTVNDGYIVRFRKD